MLRASQPRGVTFKILIGAISSNAISAGVGALIGGRLCAAERASVVVNYCAKLGIELSAEILNLIPAWGNLLP